ncbi:pantoate--beta-alanine ligase [Helicobacter marmotae]|uniref:Pantothenate synthetase n=1 Tax=Helicobacter marmotae TaxID=152490 RepID=A0A3D8I6G4_9HELI|nr:pantoate--beta-alanine ligase [Helicobacter marmotae]RDU60743.1 pantoate--beta-alanine ligase [Helicobacter marmotae]
MKVISTIEEMRAYRRSLSQSVGLVPTMGALHAGHISLMRASLAQNAHTIVSIFVNPTQFGANEDFDSYPRDMQKDLALCEQSGVSAVFAPSVEEMYSEDEITLNPPKAMGYILEGFDRPSHFAGVLQVVLKLFNLTQPHHAYFGQKDAQQVLLIQKMVRDLFLPIVIVPCPIQRDSDNLALSSRNVYLSEQERKRALCIPSTLMAIQNEIDKGHYEVAFLESIVQSGLSDVDRIFYAGFFSHSLKPIKKIVKGESIVLIAARVGQTRLLDNLWI